MNSLGMTVSYFSTSLSSLELQVKFLLYAEGGEKRPETKISKLAEGMQLFLLSIFLSWGINFLFSSTVCATFK